MGKRENIPDVEKCALLASVYGIALVKEKVFADKINMAMKLASNLLYEE